MHSIVQVIGGAFDFDFGEQAVYRLRFDAQPNRGPAGPAAGRLRLADRWGG